MFDEHLATCR